MLGFAVVKVTAKGLANRLLAVSPLGHKDTVPPKGCLLIIQQGGKCGYISVAVPSIESLVQVQELMFREHRETWTDSEMEGR